MRYDAMLAVLTQLRVVIRMMRSHYRRVERVCGVGGAHVWALAQISSSPGLTMGELAHQLAIHQSTASNMVERLEKDGLVSRIRSADDRRIVRLQATARGNRVIARAPTPVRGLLQQALMDLPLAGLKGLRDRLGELLVSMHARDAGASSLVLADLIGREHRSKPSARARSPQASR